MPRRKGDLNQDTKQRLRRFHRLLAAGLPEWEAKERMDLTERQWKTLRLRHLETMSPQNNAEFYGSFEARTLVRQQELAQLLMEAKGVLNDPSDPESGWKIPPNRDLKKQIPRIIKLMQELEHSRVEVGVRLGVLRAAPTRLEVGHRDLSQMTDAELEAEFREVVSQTAAAVGVPEQQLAGLLAGPAGPGVRDAEIEGEGEDEDDGKGDGKG